eukprot:COSAG02_NODE_9307_length_2260_cov_2.597711_2_plen_178_part_00
MFITYALCFCGWRVQYVLRGDSQAGAKQEEGSSPTAGGNEGKEGEVGEGSEDNGKDKKKKQPLGPKVMKCCQKKIPGLDSLLLKQYDFVDTCKPATLVLTLDVAIKHLVGSAPPGAPKPNPGAVAKEFLAKIKHKIKNRGKVKVAVGPGELPDAVANAPDLSSGSANKLPSIEKAEP